MRWNRKSVLHSTVEAAIELGVPANARRCLAEESDLSELTQVYGVTVPVLPDYTLLKSPDRAEFHHRVENAAAMLRKRYGNSQACLKPSESGSGARITSGITLSETTTLSTAADEDWA